jgi:hypothetical protein
MVCSTAHLLVCSSARLLACLIAITRIPPSAESPWRARELPRATWLPITADIMLIPRPPQSSVSARPLDAILETHLRNLASITSRCPSLANAASRPPLPMETMEGMPVWDAPSHPTLT